SPATCETGTSYGGASNHRDPGDWEWCTYMPRFGGSCKCNDIWNLWNCSSSGTQAFRCVNGKVELEQCTGGCVVQPVGVDDQGKQAPPPPPPPPQSDAGPPTRQPGDTSRNTGAGCAIAPATRAHTPLVTGLLLFPLLRARRRAPRRRSPR